MKILLRILAVIAGVVLILPGLCTLGFGVFFSINALQGGGAGFEVPMIVGGGVLALGGLLLILSGFKR
jgi:hypothetical protein